MIHQVLSKYFFYYNLLTTTDQVKFQLRVQDFIKGREFRSRLEGPISNELKVLIAATPIQLTFGLDKYMLPHFNTIIIYPEKYWSLINKRYHKGEVNMRGGLVISLKDYLEGLKDPFDSFNTGIHEFSHALFIENFIENEDYLFINKEVIKNWHILAKDIILDIRNNLIDFIREYAAVNLQEFFAVTSEYFFENPLHFKERLPELFHLMVEIYKQDPVSLIENARTKGKI